MTSSHGRAGFAALSGGALMLPFLILESMNTTCSGRHLLDASALFAILWLLSSAAVFVLIPVISRSTSRSTWLRVALAALLTLAWSAILIDQMPCFLGVPNCD